MSRSILLTAAAFGLAALSAVPSQAAQAFYGSASSSRVSDATVAKVLSDRTGKALREFYSARGYWPVWVEDGRLSRAAWALLPMLERADLDGLRPRDYRPDRLATLAADTRGGDETDLAKAELAFSEAFAQYVLDLRKPSIETNYFSGLADPGEVTPAEVLRRAALARDMRSYVANMEWMSPHYSRIRAALAEGEGDQALPVVLHGPTMRQGDRGLRVLQVRRRLGLVESDQFDAVLFHALQDFQRKRGLSPDGVLGPQTVTALNYRRGNDMLSLRRNLDRARALPGPWEKHVLVNTATAELVYYDQGKEQGRMKVVVGTPQTPTPMMAGVLSYATLNPYWNVPVSLVRDRIAPAILQGNQLDKMGYEALDGWGADAQVMDWRDVDWEAAARGENEQRVRELPGSGNAMGDVKFMFPNDMGIFLHDTDGKHLFAKSDRYFSNGCVRLERPRELGAFLFGRPLPEPAGSNPEQHVPLPKPVQVYITYMTVESDTSGTLAYHRDIYGWDDAPLMARR